MAAQWAGSGVGRRRLLWGCRGSGDVGDEVRDRLDDALRTVGEARGLIARGGAGGYEDRVHPGFQPGDDVSVPTHAKAYEDLDGGLGRSTSRRRRPAASSALNEPSRQDEIRREVRNQARKVAARPVAPLGAIPPDRAVHAVLAPWARWIPRYRVALRAAATRRAAMARYDYAPLRANRSGLRSLSGYLATPARTYRRISTTCSGSRATASAARSTSLRA